MSFIGDASHWYVNEVLRTIINADTIIRVNTKNKYANKSDIPYQIEFHVAWILVCLALVLKW